VILVQLQRADAFRSAADLHVALRGDGHRIGLSTVYRRLHELAASGDVDCVRGDGGERLFRLRRGPAHSHYLYCRRCGADVEIGDDSLERWLEGIGSAHGYTAVRHDLALSGVCPDCTATDGGPPAPTPPAAAGPARRGLPADPPHHGPGVDAART
jgi:Fur family transcriptional regulator, ferric uptake regulator